jgi:hypothetical protein
MNSQQKGLKYISPIICTAWVKRFDVLSAKDSARSLIDCGSVRRYGLFLTEIMTIPLIAAKGKQGIWYHDEL